MQDYRQVYSHEELSANHEYECEKYIRNKFDEIKEKVRGLRDTVHVLIITETWHDVGEEQFFLLKWLQQCFCFPPE